MTDSHANVPRATDLNPMPAAASPSDLTAQVGAGSPSPLITKGIPSGTRCVATIFDTAAVD
jgi:hypothetical protein